MIQYVTIVKYGTTCEFHIADRQIDLPNGEYCTRRIDPAKHIQESIDSGEIKAALPDYNEFKIIEHPKGASIAKMRSNDGRRRCCGSLMHIYKSRSIAYCHACHKIIHI